ncbi:response regulator [Methylobacterium sp. CM6247]
MPMLDHTLRGRRIFIAENEYFLADELRRELQDAGAEVLGPVAFVQDGLRILEGSAAPDAASLDVNLDGECVYPLADVLIARSVPFVFTTGYDQGIIPDAYAHVPRLEKPVDPQIVLLALEKLLKG